MDSDLDELVADWTLVREEVDLVAGKRGSTRLGFALQLKFYGSHGRFLQAGLDSTRSPSLSCRHQLRPMISIREAAAEPGV